MSKPFVNEETQQLVIDLYTNTANTLPVIAEKAKISQRTVGRILGRKNIPKRGRSHLIGEHNPDWQGGKSVSSHGYIQVRTYNNGKAKHEYEHRLVMAQHLGRPLRKDETVHHKNGNRQDNRIENLQLRNGKHGSGSIAVCLQCGSQNIDFIEIGD